MLKTYFVRSSAFSALDVLGDNCAIWAYYIYFLAYSLSWNLAFTAAGTGPKVDVWRLSTDCRAVRRTLAE